VPYRIIWSWYTDRWLVSCYIWYSEEGTGRGRSPPKLFLAVPNATAHPPTANVPITVLLYNGGLHCGFNVPIKGLMILLSHDEQWVSLRRRRYSTSWPWVRLNRKPKITFRELHLRTQPVTLRRHIFSHPLQVAVETAITPISATHVRTQPVHQQAHVHTTKSFSFEINPSPSTILAHVTRFGCFRHMLNIAS